MLFLVMVEWSGKRIRMDLEKAPNVVDDDVLKGFDVFKIFLPLEVI